MSDDIESEMLDHQLRAARRAQVLMAPCVHCFMVPDEILTRDEYGYPKTTGETHEPGCPLHVVE